MYYVGMYRGWLSCDITSQYVENTNIKSCVL